MPGGCHVEPESVCQTEPVPARPAHDSPLPTFIGGLLDWDRLGLGYSRHEQACLPALNVLFPSFPFLSLPFLFPLAGQAAHLPAIETLSLYCFSWQSGQTDRSGLVFIFFTGKLWPLVGLRVKNTPPSDPKSRVSRLIVVRWQDNHEADKPW